MEIGGVGGKHDRPHEVFQINEGLAFSTEKRKDMKKHRPKTAT